MRSLRLPVAPYHSTLTYTAGLTSAVTRLSFTRGVRPTAAAMEGRHGCSGSTRGSSSPEESSISALGRRPCAPFTSWNALDLVSSRAGDLDARRQGTSQQLDHGRDPRALRRLGNVDDSRRSQ